MLNNVTHLAGNALNDVSKVADTVVDLVSPALNHLGHIPVIGDVVLAAGKSISNISGLIDETGDYVTSIQPVELVNDLLQNPLATVGGVVQDVSGTVDALLNDISPLTGTLSTLPIAGGVVAVAGGTVDAVNHGLDTIGAQLTTLPPLNLSLDISLSYA
jgi:tetrahydromethanopterin S-methyltransferase subunit B